MPSNGSAVNSYASSNKYGSWISERERSNSVINIEMLTIRPDRFWPTSFAPQKPTSTFTSTSMSTSKSKPEFEVAETALRQRVLSPSLSEFQSKSQSRPSSQTQEHILQREIIPMVPIIPIIPVIPEDAESLGNTNTNSNSSPDQQNVPMTISTVPPSSSAPAFTATGSGGSVTGTSGGIVKSITMNEPITTGAASRLPRISLLGKENVYAIIVVNSSSHSYSNNRGKSNISNSTSRISNSAFCK